MGLVYCGTAPSRISARLNAYYANPGNRFWRALFETGVTERLFAPQEYPALWDVGVGLTDLAKTHIGNDADLPKGAFDAAALAQKLRRARPAALAFTSKNAARGFIGSKDLSYGRQIDWNGIAIFVLPSPSGLARGFWDIGPWQEVADFLRAWGNAKSKIRC